jgi:hypothetical protein
MSRRCPCNPNDPQEIAGAYEATIKKPMMITTNEVVIDSFNFI